MHESEEAGVALLVQQIKTKYKLNKKKKHQKTPLTRAGQQTKQKSGQRHVSPLCANKGMGTLLLRLRSRIRGEQAI